MIIWLQIIPALIVATAVSLLPGLATAWLLRLRGLTLVVAAIAASFVAIALASVAAPAIGMSWGILPVAIVSAALALFALVVRLLDRREIEARPKTPRSLRFATFAAFAVAAGLISFVLLKGVGGPQNFSQSYDSVFHLNAVAWILETGNASPFSMTMTVPEQDSSFYPTLWHATVALVVQFTGASIPLATNALSMSISAFIWPAAILFFARPFYRATIPNILAAGILAAAFSAFPYRLFAWGILYPNLLSVALLPIVLGFLHLALRHHQLHSTARIGALWIAFAGSLGAATLAHPNAILSVAALAAPLLVVVARENFRRFGRTPISWWRFAGVCIALLVGIAFWRSISTSDSGRDFPPTPLSAFFGALTNSPITSAHAWFVTVFVLTGVMLLLLARRHRWLVASYFVVVLLYTISAGLDGPFRDFFTVGWYNDANRIAALLPVAAMPLAVRAATEFIALIQVGATTWRPSTDFSLKPIMVQAIAVALALLLLLTGTRGTSMESSTRDIRKMFTLDKRSKLVSAEEFKLYSRLQETTPSTAVIAGNPWNGSSLAFALGQRTVLFPHLKGVYSPETIDFALHFREMDAAEACEVTEELGVTHIIGSSDPSYENGGGEYAGLDDLREDPLLEEVDREGDAVLYRISGC